ncbi:phosphatase inhibitor-domain-containing protein [Mycena albidolilacea]|uniref:Type 1 phosphatases regulator n=1 Tax=Mycena albidolilacea TaxID=1033008 RepID=A0AAD7EMU3_9AGAR|nr:phosphatase inhibitor-domain-containing protein [Mycena albidolilacea]
MAYLATQRRPGTSAPGDGSRTITITPTPANEEGGSAEEGSGSGGVNEGGEPASTIVGALHLRGGARRTRARVAWDEDVVDNEGCGRKSSKICCIYHKPKDFDESSSEDDSSDEDSDSSLDDGRARPRPRSGSNHNHNHHHPHPHPDGAAAAQRNPQTQIAQLEEAAEPNAYEMVPSGKKGKGKRKSIG